MTHLLPMPIASHRLKIQQANLPLRKGGPGLRVHAWLWMRSLGDGGCGTTAIAMILMGVAFLSPPVTAEDPWPEFRGPAGDGIAEVQSVALRWDRETNVRWRTELPGHGWSSPVVGGGVVYLSAAIQADQREQATLELSLLRLDAENGRLLGVYPLLQQAEDAPDIHKKNSHASPTPLLTPERVFVHFGHQGTVCTDRQGKILWVNRDNQYSPVHGNGGSPVLVGGVLIFTCDGAEQPYVVGLDAVSGKQLWRTDRPVEASRKFSFATPSVFKSATGSLVIAPGSDCVVALDPATGDLRWWVRYDGYSVVPKPVFSQGRVLVTTGFGPTTLLAIDPQGTGDITQTQIAWQLQRGIPKTPSLIAWDDLVFLISDDGIALCIDANSGDVVWRQRLGGNYSASPILVAGRLYFTSEEGVTTVVAATRQFQKLATNDLQEAVLASPAVADKAIFIRTETAIYRIEE